MLTEVPSEYPLGLPRPLVVTFAPTAPRGRALDLGAGAGRESLYLSDLGFEVDAVDDWRVGYVSPEESGFVALKAVAAERSARINMLSLDLRHFEMQSQRYTLILALYSLQYCSPQEFVDLAARMERALAPGGRLIMAIITRTVAGPSTLPAEAVRAREPDFSPATPEELSAYFPMLRDRHLEHITVWDLGHPGAEDPHWHTILELVADKPAE